MTHLFKKPKEGRHAAFVNSKTSLTHDYKRFGIKNRNNTPSPTQEL